MKAYLKLLLLVLVFISGTHSLFTSVPANNFTISGLNMSQPHTVVDGTGTKVIFWTMYPPQLQIYHINGTALCSLNSTNFIRNIIWPANSGPMIEYTIGSIINTLDETTCQTTKSYNLAQIVNVPLEGFSLGNLILLEEKPILTVNGRYAVYQIDLTEQKLINTYKVNNQTISNIIENSCYSGDFNYIYILTSGTTDLSMTVKIFDAKKQNESSLKEVKMPDSTRIASIAPARDNSSIIIYGLSAADFTTGIFTLDTAGNLLTRISRMIWIPAALITDTNLFDTAVLFNPDLLNVELVRIMDGKSLQAFPFPDMENIKNADYNHKTMAILMKNSQVLTYSYQPDQQDANPDDEGSSHIVWIIVGVVLGVLVIGAAAFFIIKKKKLFKKQEENYGKIQDEV